MAKQNKSKKKKRPASQASAAKPAKTAPAPEQPPRTAKLMAALCYLNVLILIPACTKWPCCAGAGHGLRLRRLPAPRQ